MLLSTQRVAKSQWLNDLLTEQQPASAESVASGEPVNITKKCFWAPRCVSHSSVQFTQSFPTLCKPMDCSTPGFPVHHQLPEPAQTHGHWVGDAIQPSHLCRPLLLPPSVFPASGSFQTSQFFTSGGQSIGVSASTSVFPMNTQDWFPLGWTGWISLQSKGFSRVFSNTTVQKHQFFGAQLSLYSKSHIHMWLLTDSVTNSLSLYYATTSDNKRAIVSLPFFPWALYSHIMSLGAKL